MNEDNFIYDGITYRANKDGYTGCSMCALFNDNCALIQRPSCNGSNRKDGINVNFEVVK